MKDHLKRFWGLYCSLIVVVTILCVGIVGTFAWQYWNRDASGGQVIPASTSNSPSAIQPVTGAM